MIHKFNSFWPRAVPLSKFPISVSKEIARRCIERKNLNKLLLDALGCRVLADKSPLMLETGCQKYWWIFRQRISHGMETFSMAFDISSVRLQAAG
jgi:hypothetical protein